MTGKGSRRSSSGQRICNWCHAGISEQRPVFLVGNPAGQILGPFHAGCAERLKIEAHRIKEMPNSGRYDVLGTWPSIREETLPE